MEQLPKALVWSESLRLQLIRIVRLTVGVITRGPSCQSRPVFFSMRRIPAGHSLIFLPLSSGTARPFLINK